MNEALNDTNGKLVLETGDWFCSDFPAAVLGSVIKFGQKLQSHDWDAEYGHAGIISNGVLGISLEALWSVKHQNFYEAYMGAKILVVRPVYDLSHKPVSQIKIRSALRELENKHLGDAYPTHRLLLHALGLFIVPLPKLIHWHRMLCSEVVAKDLYLIGCRHRHYFGTNPDTLADEGVYWRNYKVIFKDVLTESMVPSGVKWHLKQQKSKS
jgi:hypothetical protein